MTARAAAPEVRPIDWTALGKRFNEISAHMIHHEERQLYGSDFYAEALRRVFGFRPVGDPPRALPYETVNASTGLITVAEADYIRDGHTVIDRLNRERAERERDEARTETRRVMVDARRDAATAIREACNERTVPSRFRREGVLLAADWIDPDCPTRPYSM